MVSNESNARLDREGWKKQGDFYQQNDYKASAIKTVVMRNGQEERIELKPGEKLPSDAKLLRYERSIFRRDKVVTLEDTDQNALMFTKKKTDGTTSEKGLDVEAKGLLTPFGSVFGDDMFVVKRGDKGVYREGHLTRNNWNLNPFNKTPGYRVEVDRDQRLKENADKSDISKEYSNQKDLDKNYSESKNFKTASDKENKYEHNRFGRNPANASPDQVVGGKLIKSNIPADAKTVNASNDKSKGPHASTKSATVSTPAQSNKTNPVKSDTNKAIPPSGDMPTGITNVKNTTDLKTTTVEKSAADNKTTTANNSSNQNAKDASKAANNNGSKGGVAPNHMIENRAVSADKP